jgi:hypothetical protein
MPPACDKRGGTQCGTGTQAATPVRSSGATTGKVGATTAGTPAGTTAGGTTGPVVAPSGSAPGASTATATGAVVQDGTTTVLAADGTALAAGAAATPFTLAERDGWRLEHTLMALTALTLLLATAVPALIITRARR